ncbi:hypothetical protein HR12_40685 [Microbacterium sp. SUBG005]|nr:hypothetical protein HR12_40685 [Microbacterium sp. SUBG005]
MPMPVSAKRRITSSGDTSPEMRIEPPAGVYLMALLRMLSKACRSRKASPTTSAEVGSSSMTLTRRAVAAGRNDASDEAMMRLASAVAGALWSRNTPRELARISEISFCIRSPRPR